MTKTPESRQVRPCSFPGCLAGDWHDGDHLFNRSAPYGELRLLQVFECRMFQRCDICKDEAKAFYVDGIGKGWVLCGGCGTRYSAREMEAA